MPSGPIAHISFLVKDLDQSIENWTKILSVLDPKQLEKKLVRYDDFDGGGDKMRWCTFVSEHGVEIQLMEPDPESALGRRLAAAGDHVHHLHHDARSGYVTQSVAGQGDRADRSGLA